MHTRLLDADDAAIYRELRLRALSTNPEAFATTYDEFVTRTLTEVAAALPPDDQRFTLGAFTTGDANGQGNLVGIVTVDRGASVKLRHIANVVGMYVAAHARNQGVGRSLLTEVIGRCGQMDGLEQLRLCVVQDNTAATSFYQTAGFRIFCVEPDALKTAARAWNEVHMVLPLQAAPVARSNEEVQVFPPRSEGDRRWLTELWQREWGGETMISRGQVHRLADLQAFVAKLDGALIGAATYRVDPHGGCELLSINATSQGGGVGTRLLSAVENAARRGSCQRVWLITSNDNLDALRFYQRRGYRMTAIYPQAIDEARRIKWTIPLQGDHGIEIHDEIELAKGL